MRVLPLPQSSRLLHQLPQQRNLTLNSIVLGDNALQLTDFLDEGYERGMGVVQLGSEVAEGGGDDVVNGFDDGCSGCSGCSGRSGF
jgi:hypothetical protein